METTREAEPSVPGPIAVEFELTPEDWVEVSLEHSWRSKQLREARRTIRALVATIFVVLALLGLLNGSTGMAVVSLLVGGVLFAALDPLLRSSQRSQLRRFAVTGIANGMFGRHRVELRPEGMLDATEGYDWLTRWPAIDRVEEGEGAFLVYTGPNALLPIPHSAFRDSATLRSFADAFYQLRQSGEQGVLPGGGAPDAG